MVGFSYAAAQHELAKYMPRGMELGAENRWRVFESQSA
jgi:hypothetical protein